MVRARSRPGVTAPRTAAVEVDQSPINRYVSKLRALSSAGRERLPYKQEAAGSNPAAPIRNYCRRLEPQQITHLHEDLPANGQIRIAAPDDLGRRANGRQVLMLVGQAEVERCAGANEVREQKIGSPFAFACIVLVDERGVEVFPAVIDDGAYGQQAAELVVDLAAHRALGEEVLGAAARAQ